MRSDDEVDERIEQITVDAYGDEGYWSFLQTFEDGVEFPFPATLAGHPSSSPASTSMATNDEDWVVVIERADQSHRVSLLDVETAAELEAALLLAAYKCWLGIS